MESHQNTNDDLIGLGEMGKYAHVSREAIFQAIRRGILRAEKVNGVWVSTKANIDEYITNKYNREEKAKDSNGNPLFDIGKGIMSVKASAKFLSEQLGRKIAVNRVYYLIARGYLVAYKSGKSWVLKEEDLQDIIKIESDAEMLILQK